MGFLEYVYQYYGKRISYLETVKIADAERSQLFSLLKEASALKKFMIDNKEEGYQETYDKFCQG